MEIWFHTYGTGFAPPGWAIRSLPYTNRLYVVLEGSGWFVSEKGDVRLRSGMLYLFPHRLSFNARQDENDPINHLYFDFMLTPPLTGEEIVELPIRPETLIWHTVSALLLAVCPRDHRTKDDDVLVHSYFSCLLRLVLKECGVERLSDSRLTAALACIHDRFSEPLNDAMLAELAHMEKNHFIRVFRRAIGMTPYQYLRQFRLNRAASLISGGSTVQEAARLCGFESASSLSHAMRKSRGLSPGALAGRIEPVRTE